MPRSVAAAEPEARRALLARLLEEEAARPLTSLASTGQKRLWFAMRAAGESAVYNCPLTVEVHGPVDDGALSGALQDLVDRHEALRTTFREDDGELYQVVAPRGAVPLERPDDSRRIDTRSYASELAESVTGVRAPFVVTSGGRAKSSGMRSGSTPARACFQ